MALSPTVFEDSREWVITKSGVHPYPKAAYELVTLAESRGWWALDGLPNRLDPSGLIHRIRVEVGRPPIAGRFGFRYMALWTSEDSPQFSLAKIMAFSTEWGFADRRDAVPIEDRFPGYRWVQIPGVSDVMTKIEKFPYKPPRPYFGE